MSRICTTILGGQHDAVRPKLGGVPMLHHGEIPLQWNLGDNTKMKFIDASMMFIFVMASSVFENHVLQILTAIFDHVAMHELCLKKNFRIEIHR